MENLICANVFVPLRKGPSHSSEQGSQILFGEKYSVVERAANWIKVKTEYDDYLGWIDYDHHLYFEAGERENPGILARRTGFRDENGHLLELEAGSEIYNFNKTDNSFAIGKNKFSAKNKVTLSPAGENISVTAMQFLNCPYLWGGRISGGIDCSGLTQIVYKIHGYRLPRDSFMQAEVGNTLNFIEEAGEGDLLFFDNEKGNISHVGIMLDKGRIIHSSGKVRIDRIDHQGIFNEGLNRYTHRLRTIRKLGI